MSMAHLSDVDFVAYVERNAKGQPPWQFIPPDDVLRLVALWRAAQARIAEQTIEILRLKATCSCCGDTYDDNECEAAVAAYEQASGKDYWEERIEELHG